METLVGHQLEAPRYNHPCEDLLDSGRREEYINTCVPLFKASISGDLEAARVILQGRAHLVRYSITKQKETPLHVVAAVHNDPEFVKYLVDMMSEDDLKLQNEEGNNAFCVATIAGNWKMAMIMLQKNRELLTIRGSGNMMSLYLAVLHKQRDMITYLYDNSQRMASDGWTDDDRNTVFLECIKIEHFDVALRMLNDREELPQDKYVWNVLHVLAPMTHAFRPKLSIMLKRFGCYLERCYEDRLPGKERKATHLLRKIWKKFVVKKEDEIDAILRGPVIKIVVKNEDEIDEKDTYPSRILFVAAENGNVRFIVELIGEYPDLIWKANDDGQTIFHIAVIHGYASIFDLLYELGAMKDKITRLKDKDGNTLLHSVSMNTGGNSHRGAAFHLHRKLAWFKEVEALVPPCYKLLKNAAGQTPKELFTQNHKHLLPESEKWVKEMSNQCLVVAALITTISFSAAFTIPGGYNQNTGFPIFIKNRYFLQFAISDAISFILSSVSILIFLSLSFSRYSEDNFLYPIFLKIYIGFAALANSVTTLMVAFSTSFYVLYDNKQLLPRFMTSLAYLPMAIVFLMSFSFVGDLSRTLTLVRRPRGVLFKQNPKTKIWLYRQFGYF